MWLLVGRLLTYAHRLLSSRAVQTVGLGVAISDVVNLDMLRAEALRQAGTSDPQALDEAARTAARLLGLDGSEVLWPISRRTGQQIVPKYLTIDLQKGRAWYTDTYNSSNYVRKLKRGRFGGARRFGSWRRGAPAVIRNG